MKAFWINIKNRLFSHWITSVIGIAVLVVAVVLVITGSLNYQDSWFMLTVILPLIFSKDNRLIAWFKSENGKGKAVILIGLLGLMGLLSTGCYTQKRCNQLFPPTVIVHDSIHTVYCETVRDTTITLPADSSWLIAWLKCDSAGNVFVDHSTSANGSNAFMQFQLYNNTLYVKFLEKSFELRLQLKDKLIEYYRDKQTTIEHTTNILKPWQKTLLWSAGVFLFLLIIATVIIILLWIYRKKSKMFL